MMTEKPTTPLHGGNEDGLGISPSVQKPSTEKNQKHPATSAAGAVNEKPDTRK